MNKCTKDGWCPGLEHVFTEENSKGINPMRIMDGSTGESRVIGVVFKTTERDKGIMFNHCPFCGADISYNGKKKEK